jgi:hypothetical protein
MASLSEMLAAHQYMNPTAPDDGRSAFGEFSKIMIDKMKEEQTEKRRQENVKKQMANAQQMMQQMAQMDDNSSVGRANVAIDDEQQKRNRGVIKVSTMLPQKEMTVDETGAVNIKLGYRQASPQEQQAQFATQKAQMDLQREEGKRSLLGGYAKGELQEGAVIQAMKEFDITPEEFDMAAKARDRMKQIVSMQTFSGQPANIPTEAQAEQSFRFKPQPASEVKAIRDMAKEDKQSALQSQGAIDNAQLAVSAIDHLEKNVNYFGGLEGRIAPAFPGKIEFNKNYEFLKAKNILNILGEMKSQSKTGATGFGAMNEKELKLIQDAAQRLDVTMDEKTAGKYLNEMKQSFQKIIDREKNGYQNEGHSGTTQSSVPEVGGMFNGEKVMSIKRIR